MGKTSSAVKNRYIAKAYDRINLTVPKGQKEKIDTYAKKKGFRSINGYINHLIAADMAAEEIDGE